MGFPMTRREAAIGRCWRHLVTNSGINHRVPWRSRAFPDREYCRGLFTGRINEPLAFRVPSPFRR